MKALFEEEVCYFADIGMNRTNVRLPNVSARTYFMNEGERCGLDSDVVMSAK